jgi:hypothetical protein
MIQLRVIFFLKSKIQISNAKSNPKFQRKVAWQQRCFTQGQKNSLDFDI